MNRHFWPVLVALLTLVPCPAGAQALVTERSLSLNAALELATAALEACRKHGSQVTITVLDHAGRTKVLLREDGANPHSVQHSFNKAYTALTYRMPSGVWGDVCPWNRFSKPHHEINFTPIPEILNLSTKQWEEMTEESFKNIFRHSPLKRTKFSGIQRNLRFITRA